MKHTWKHTSRNARLGLLVALAGLGTAACDSSAGESVAAAPNAPAPETPAAWLEYEVNEHDFGEVHPDSLHTKDFELRAAGREDLVIKDLARKCGCTEAEMFVLSDEGAREPLEFGLPYAPGTRFDLATQLNTTGKHGEQAQVLSIIVEDQSTLDNFTLQADIRSFIVADPPALQLDRISSLREEQARVTFTTKSKERFALRAIREIRCEDVELELLPVQPGDDGRAESWTMDVRIKLGAPAGPKKCRVLLESDVPNQKAPAGEDGVLPFHKSEFSIAAVVDPVMKVWPERINFGRVTEQGARRRFVIRNQDPEFAFEDLDLKLLGKDGKTPSELTSTLELSAKTTDPGRSWEITMFAKDLPESGPFDGVLEVGIGHSIQERVVVPFQGYALPR